jgi:hypothetical protein
LVVGLVALAGALSLKAADTFNSAYISEVLARNESGLKDEKGNRPGWIEIYNASSSVINLNGWYLTDSPTNLAKWRFPSVGILPDRFLLVFASGENRTNDLAHLHTDFQLPKEGGFVALVNPVSNIISELSYKKQKPDISYGRLRGEPAIHGAMARPTPGRPNMVAGKGFADEVIFSRPGGTFSDPFRLSLSSRGSGTIRYTLDGSVPTTKSQLFESPLEVTNSICVRARAFREGVLPGPPHSEAYVQLSTNVAAFSSTLPVLVLDTFGKQLPTSSAGSLAYASLYEPIGRKTSLQSRPTLTTRASFHVRGSTSSGFPQSPFALKFMDEFEEERHLSILGLPADADWVLYAPNAYDPVMIHNPFVYQLSRDLGRYSPRTRFVEVFVSRQAGHLRELHYNGVYVLTEKIRIAKHRVDIDRLGAEDMQPPNVSGGYLMKFDRVGPGESGVFGTGGRGLVYVEPKEQLIQLPQRAEQRRYVKKFFSDFENALNGPNFKDPVSGYRAYLDVDAAIDFHVLEVLSGNVDAMVLSTYFYKARNGKIVCGPHWDFDRALGSTDGRDDNPANWNTGPFFGGEWWPQLFSDVDFWQSWVDRWEELRGSHFATTNLNRLIDALAAEVREAQPREYARWGLQPRGGSYQSEVDLMKAWLSSRVEFIDSQLTAAPGINFSNATGGKFTVTLTGSTNATIYYTKGAGDPRRSQGAVSTNAIAYAGPFQVEKGVELMARAYDTKRRQVGGPPVSTPWSRAVKKTAR